MMISFCCDFGKNSERILIFTTDRCLNWKESNILSANGTFSTAPLLFHQLYTIHVNRKEAAVPCLFKLLPNKSELTYKQLISQIFKQGPTLKPKFIIFDL